MNLQKNSIQLVMITKAALFLIGVVFSINSYAALNAYLWLTGEIQGAIDGGVTQVGREGTILIVGYSHDNDSVLDWQNCRSPGSNHAPLVIKKKMDASSAKLYEAYANAEIFSTFTLRFYEPSPSGIETNTNTVELVNARIVAINQEMLNNRNPQNVQYPVMEDVKFVYDTIIRTRESTGTSAMDQWRQTCEK